MNEPAAKEAERQSPFRCAADVGVQPGTTGLFECPPERKFQRAAPETGAPIVWLVGVAGLVILFFFNPIDHHFFPPCLFHKLTGLHCPGCGATRALHRLMHGQIGAAIHCNALLVLSLPFFAWLAARFARRRWRGENTTLQMPGWWLWIFLVAVLVFTVWRNLPSGAWLSP